MKIEDMTLKEFQGYIPIDQLIIECRKPSDFKLKPEDEEGFMKGLSEGWDLAFENIRKMWAIAKVKDIDESCAIGDYENKKCMKEDLLIRKFLMNNVPIADEDLDD